MQALYSEKTVYTRRDLVDYEHAWRTGTGYSFRASVILCDVGLFFFFTKATGAGVAFFLLAAMKAGIPLLLDNWRIYKKFKKDRTVWDSETVVSLYEEFAAIAKGNEEKRFDYDEFYNLVESPENLFLVASPRDILIVRKNKCEKGLVEAIREAVVS